MNVQELLLNFPDGNIPYSELLLADEWKKKREQIIDRDYHMCTKCGTTKSVFYHGKIITSIKTVTQFEEELGGWEMIEIETDKHYYIHVHHKLYIKGKWPWEYENNQLITLCNWCHWDFHVNNDVPLIDEDEITHLHYTKCSRCNGMGYFPQYSHVEHGLCFKCGGARYEELIELPTNKWFK